MFGLFGSKGPFNAQVSPSSCSFPVKAGDNLLKAALDAGLPWPHNCRVGSCGQCRSRLVSGKIKPLNDFSYVLTREELDAGMILACQTSLRSDVEVEVPLETGVVQQAAKSVPGVVDRWRLLTHDILEIGLRLNEPLPPWLAGQYAELSVPGVIDQPRSYSFASAPRPDEPLQINFFVRLVPGGEMSTWLHQADRSGTPVVVRGPFGSFWLRESTAPMLCVAGGSGLAPIKALLEQVADGGFDREVTFVFGARTARDLYCLDAIRDLEQRSDGRFRFVPVLSEEPGDSDWSGRRGLCTEYIAAAVPDVAACDAYLCGPPGMVDSAVAVLRGQGLGEERIYFDKFLDASHMPCGRQATG